MAYSAAAALGGGFALAARDDTLVVLDQRGSPVALLDVKECCDDSGGPLELPKQANIVSIDARDELVLLADTGNFCALLLRSTEGVSFSDSTSAPQQWLSSLQVKHTLFDAFNGYHADDGEGAFLCPGGVSISAGKLLLCVDKDGHRVNVYDARDGELVTTIGEGFGSREGEFHSPTDVAYLEQGLLAVADTGNARIQLYRLAQAEDSVDDSTEGADEAVFVATQQPADDAG